MGGLTKWPGVGVGRAPYLKNSTTDPTEKSTFFFRSPVHLHVCAVKNIAEATNLTNEPISRFDIRGRNTPPPPPHKVSEIGCRTSYAKEFQLYSVTAHRCASRLKKFGLRSGSHTIDIS